jgi:hypothetical protein
MTIGVEKFAKGFVAAMVDLEQFSIEPKSPRHLRGFWALHDLLDKEVERVRYDPNKREWFRDIVRLRNSLVSGPTGSFDQFESALRDLQSSVTSSPNPSYVSLEFTVSRPFARSLLDELNEDERILARAAATAFVKSQSLEGGI